MGKSLKKPVVFERGLNVYLVAPLAPMSPSEEQIEEYAFAGAVKQAREKAPNPHLSWFGGHYVEADNPNANGAMWTAKELAIKAVTPMFMPVTVMHDPRTAVGLIADVSLKTPDTDSVERSKIDTALALWGHRFPEVVEEAQHNYAQGTLMQSMECFAPDYSCSSCGMTYHKLPDGSEREQWCDHLLASDPSGGYAAKGQSDESQTAVRILRNVTFSGTGLIFGSRGAKGADAQAYLESFQEELAELHQEQRAERSTPKRRPRNKLMDPIEISKQEYNELLQAKSERDAAVKASADATEAREAAEATAATEKTRADEAEAKLTQETEAKEAAEAKVSAAEETASQATLATERFDKLGDGFKAKLGEKTKANLQEDAKTLTDEKWSARLDELAEAYNVKPDEAGEESDKDTVFAAEEVAASRAGSTTSDKGPSRAAQGTVVGGLFKTAVASK